MNTKALWITIIAVIVIAVLAFKGGLPSRTDAPEPTGTVTKLPSTTATFYDQSTGEAVDAVFTDDSVTFTQKKLGTLTLPQALSADGARYANADESIVFWNKGTSVFITQNGAIVFNGSVDKPAVSGKLPAGSLAPGDASTLLATWVWQKTTTANGAVVNPKKPGIFAITFDAKGHISGKTDCNGFGGDYTRASDGIISFGPFISTQMYCEGSQEQEFTATLSKASRYGIDAKGNLVITIGANTGTMTFAKK